MIKIQVEVFEIMSTSGVGGLNCIKGQLNSSTRMELAAWLAVLAANKPIHMATTNDGENNAWDTSR